MIPLHVRRSRCHNQEFTSSACGTELGKHRDHLYHHRGRLEDHRGYSRRACERSVYGDMAPPCTKNVAQRAQTHFGRTTRARDHDFPPENACRWTCRKNPDASLKLYRWTISPTRDSHIPFKRNRHGKGLTHASSANSVARKLCTCLDELEQVRERLRIWSCEVRRTFFTYTSYWVQRKPRASLRKFHRI